MTPYNGVSFFQICLRFHKTVLVASPRFVQCRSHFIKHFTVKRYGKIVQAPQGHSLCYEIFDHALFTEALAELMVTVVELNPSCCKSSHLPVLFAAYSASLSITGENNKIMQVNMKRIF